MIMKALTNLINKVGIDKVLHFVIGALLNALLYPFGREYTIIGIMAVFMLSCVKETIDSYEDGNKCDWWDIAAGTIGAACMCGYFYLIQLLQS